MDLWLDLFALISFTTQPNTASTKPLSMSAHPSTGPPETPRRVRHSFDRIIGRLNAPPWGLELPNLHGTQEIALEHADAEDSLARKCAGRIRYLCYRDCKLGKVIDDFEEDAPRICSEWKYKPSQEEGTLPKMPVTKSFISTRPAIPRKHRQLLLERLFDLLDEEFKLARQSDVYIRTSLAAPATATQVSPVGVQGKLKVPSGVSSGLRTTDTRTTRRETDGVTVDEPKKEMLRSARMRESTKRKSLDSEKVRRRPVADLSLCVNRC